MAMDSATADEQDPPIRIEVVDEDESVRRSFTAAASFGSPTVTSISSEAFWQTQASSQRGEGLRRYVDC